jgi:hypothetical protein
MHERRTPLDQAGRVVPLRAQLDLHATPQTNGGGVDAASSLVASIR